MKKRGSAAVVSLLILLVSPLLIVGCGSGHVEPGKTVMAPTPISVALHPLALKHQLSGKNISETVPVFICSSRNLKESAAGVDPFGNKRSHQLVPYLAVAQVSIGANQPTAKVLHETLHSVKRKRTRVKVESVKMYDSPRLTPFSSSAVKRREFIKNRWLAEMRAQVKRSKSKEITIFVHGYNTHLVSNTELLAEMYHYAGRDGVVINYEWPSAGKLLGYFQDKGNAEYSTRLFRSLISRLAPITGAKRIKIIAHSAGNPIVVNALKDLRLIDKKLNAQQLQQKYKISQVVLAAPDMDSMRFMNAVFDRFFDMTPSVNVYSYTKDRALMLSSKLFKVNRLGNAIGKLKGWEKVALSQAKNIYLIDVTEPQKKFGSMLGHGYFHRDPWVSSDIIYSFKSPNPKNRGLILGEDGVFWKFPKDYPTRVKNR